MTIPKGYRLAKDNEDTNTPGAVALAGGRIAVPFRSLSDVQQAFPYNSEVYVLSKKGKPSEKTFTVIGYESYANGDSTVAVGNEFVSYWALGVERLVKA